MYAQPRQDSATFVNADTANTINTYDVHQNEEDAMYMLNLLEDKFYFPYGCLENPFGVGPLAGPIIHGVPSKPPRPEQLPDRRHLPESV